MFRPPRAGLVVDVGIGDSIDTTLELAAAVRTLAADAQIVGVDHDRRRVDDRCHDDDQRHDGVELRVGGFELPVEPGSVHLIRAMNVLRGYPSAVAVEALRAMSTSLADDGLLVEGTSDAAGHVLTAQLQCRVARGLSRRGLVFATDFAHGFAPIMFRDYLPRELRRDVVPGSAIYTLLGRWTGAWTRARESSPLGPRTAFSASVLALSNHGFRLIGDGIAWARWPR